MTIKDNFLSPDYYPSFTCKGPLCRHTCCNGLTINMSQQEYFKLVGLSCSDELRQGLDLAIKPLSNPDPYKYAELCHDFFGNCRMLMDNGWCRLQYECGEEVMTYACRYFPRSPRLNISPRVSCSCGCEKTIEMLIDSESPVFTCNNEFSFELAGEEKKSEIVTNNELVLIQKNIFDILQDTDLSIDNKISLIKKYLNGENVTDVSKTTCKDSCSINTDSLNSLIRIAEFAKGQYYTMSDYCEAFLRLAKGSDVHVQDALKAGKEKLHAMFPDLDLWICKMFVNDIFYSQFPFMDKDMSMSQAGLLLEYEIKLLQVLLYSNVDNITCKDDLVDLCMYFFRMADFTPFSHNVIVLLGR